MSLHIRKLDGKNSHHIVEGAFKSVGRTLKAAVAINPETKDEIPSTKGVL
jgi:imidazoleglycerol-phosphate dehydratase